jgi:hypothetical protein
LVTVWCFAAIGPIFSLTIIAALCLLRYYHVHEDIGLTEPSVGSASLWLIVMHVILQFVLVAVMMGLHTQLLKRRGKVRARGVVAGMTCVFDCCGMCCCPSCTMAGSLHHTRLAGRCGTSDFRDESELAAYPA